jgi:hypothetical protein
MQTTDYISCNRLGCYNRFNSGAMIQAKLIGGEHDGRIVMTHPRCSFYSTFGKHGTVVYESTGLINESRQTIYLYIP